MSPYRTPAVIPPEPPPPRRKVPLRARFRKAGYWAAVVIVQIAYAWLLQRR